MTIRVEFPLIANSVKELDLLCVCLYLWGDETMHLLHISWILLLVGWREADGRKNWEKKKELEEILSNSNIHFPNNLFLGITFLHDLI